MINEEINRYIPVGDSCNTLINITITPKGVNEEVFTCPYFIIENSYCLLMGKEVKENKICGINETYKKDILQ
jgi:hypothetical protein